LVGNFHRPGRVCPEFDGIIGNVPNGLDGEIVSGLGARHLKAVVVGDVAIRAASMKIVVGHEAWIAGLRTARLHIWHTPLSQFAGVTCSRPLAARGETENRLSPVETS